MACENKSKPKDTGEAAQKPAGNETPTPVNKEPELPKQPSPDPTPAADVRPPVAADLAEYTKDIPGTGTKLMAKIETSMGTFNCELYGDKAPMTVANFVGLATGKKPWLSPSGMQKDKPFFDGLTFHRVIPGFMIQGGDPRGDGTGGPGYKFNDEIWQGQHIEPGVLAMANAGVRGGEGTNGSQFFIMEGARPDLDTHHTVFGKCKELDLVKKIENVPSTDDKPNTPVTINKITFSKA
ncbi:MAG TPA: peptidylprolyl isomerase [Kofleriaceae bacterium]|nr:peptidylprolyl isomerase [Kofleriaceae bacterium]